MPSQSYIDAHELTQAYKAVCLNKAGFGSLQTLAHYDVDPLDDDAEERIIEIIEDQSAEWQADYRRDAA